MTHLSNHEIEKIEALATGLADKVQALAFSTHALARSLPVELAAQRAMRIALGTADASAAQLRALIETLGPVLSRQKRLGPEDIAPDPAAPCGCRREGRGADQVS